MGPALDFLRLIWAVDHGLQRMSKWMETWLGITGPQRLVIRLVGRHPAISAGHLAAALHIHPSTLTGILKRLEARAIITRTADRQDARRSLIALTDKGRLYDIDTEGTIESSVQKLLTQFPADKIQVAQQVLQALPTIFDNVLASDPPKVTTPPPVTRGRRKGAGKSGKARV